MIAASIFIVGSAAAAWSPSIVALVLARLRLGLVVGGTTQVVLRSISRSSRPAPTAARSWLSSNSRSSAAYWGSSVVGWIVGGAGEWRLMFQLGVDPCVNSDPGASA